ncbi:SRPBCC family protein [Planomonospora parontospora]|uniref:SRPBCC family protein n=1 Tax=Planomonospora parontospora TaxID=58119 RepID=UPI001670393B|nr:SRPBCC family protein [Planomonospora parontospora]GGL13990.1 hypothetical protein GCM10014719_14920 [Planomonospora parontospora subsp. antibiotica]GII17892.1 hypothetical protein Ppa05_46180 [Planomonospora parontospora subsp. antibiotica]
MDRAPKSSARTGLLIVGVAAAAYPLLLRRRCLTWGATAEEAESSLPGDELLPDPGLVATRAVAIDAPPGAVWPWLVQMGSGRGGAYTYDWIENLFGLDMHSANEVLPQFQGLKTGDVLPLGTTGPRMRAEVMEPEQALVFRSEDGNWVWAFILRSDGETTRLVSRNRIATPDAGLLGRLVNLLIMEPGSLIMERKMLLGIKERAERLARTG